MKKSAKDKKYSISNHKEDVTIFERFIFTSLNTINKTHPIFKNYIENLSKYKHNKFLFSYEESTDKYTMDYPISNYSKIVMEFPEKELLNELKLNEYKDNIFKYVKIKYIMNNILSNYNIFIETGNDENNILHRSRYNNNYILIKTNGTLEILNNKSIKIIKIDYFDELKLNIKNLVKVIKSIIEFNKDIYKDINKDINKDIKLLENLNDVEDINILSFFKDFVFSPYAILDLDRFHYIYSLSYQIICSKQSQDKSGRSFYRIIKTEHNKVRTSLVSLYQDSYLIWILMLNKINKKLKIKEIIKSKNDLNNIELIKLFKNGMIESNKLYHFEPINLIAFFKESIENYTKDILNIYNYKREIYTIIDNNLLDTLNRIYLNDLKRFPLFGVFYEHYEDKLKNKEHLNNFIKLTEYNFDIKETEYINNFIENFEVSNKDNILLDIFNINNKDNRKDENSLPNIDLIIFINMYFIKTQYEYIKENKLEYIFKNKKSFIENIFSINDLKYLKDPIFKDFIDKGVDSKYALDLTIQISNGYPSIKKYELELFSSIISRMNNSELNTVCSLLRLVANSESKEVAFNNIFSNLDSLLDLIGKKYVYTHGRLLILLLKYKEYKDYIRYLNLNNNNYKETIILGETIMYNTNKSIYNKDLNELKTIDEIFKVLTHNISNAMCNKFYIKNLPYIHSSIIKFAKLINYYNLDYTKYINKLNTILLYENLNDFKIINILYPEINSKLKSLKSLKSNNSFDKKNEKNEINISNIKEAKNKYKLVITDKLLIEMISVITGINENLSSKEFKNFIEDKQIGYLIRFDGYGDLLKPYIINLKDNNNVEYHDEYKGKTINKDKEIVQKYYSIPKELLDEVYNI